jgi:hypothetical protein
MAEAGIGACHSPVIKYILAFLIVLYPEAWDKYLAKLLDEISPSFQEDQPAELGSQTLWQRLMDGQGPFTKADEKFKKWWSSGRSVQVVSDLRQGKPFYQRVDNASPSTALVARFAEEIGLDILQDQP